MVGGRLPRCWLDTWPTPATGAVSRRAELAHHHQDSTLFVPPAFQFRRQGADLMAPSFRLGRAGLAPASGGALITLLPPFL